MKTIYSISIIFLFGLLTACSTSYTPYAYDDVYYLPTNDPIKKVKKNPRDDFNKTNDISYDGSYENRYEKDGNSNSSGQDLYRNRYVQDEQNENSQPQSGTNVTINNNNSSAAQEDVYYDEDYAQTIQQLNSPVRSINTYDPYQRDRIIYTQDPFFTSPTLYGRYTFWDPFMPSTGLGIGWNSYNGWNVGVRAGFGWGYSNFGYGNPFCPNYYSPFGPNFGFNPYSPWGWGYGGGFYGNGYWNGYNNGFNNGFNNGYYAGGGYNTEPYNGRRRINTPRGASGSPTYSGSEASPRPDRNTGNNQAVKSGTSPRDAGGRPSRSSIDQAKSGETRTKAAPQEQQSRPTRSDATPQRYQTTKSQDSYARPEPSARPSRTTRTEPSPSQSARPTSSPRPSNDNTPSRTPNYSQPRTTTPYNSPSRRVEPQQQRRQQRTQPQRSQPQQQSRSTYERSRPSYNRSTPSYSPPSRSSGGSSPRSAPSRPSRSGGRR